MNTPLTPRPTLGVLSMGTLVLGDQLVFENNEEPVPVTVVGVPSHLRHIDVECNGDESFLLVEDFRSCFVTRSIN